MTDSRSGLMIVAETSYRRWHCYGLEALWEQDPLWWILQAPGNPHHWMNYPLPACSTPTQWLRALDQGSILNSVLKLDCDEDIWFLCPWPGSGYYITQWDRDTLLLSSYFILGVQEQHTWTQQGPSPQCWAPRVRVSGGSTCSVRNINLIKQTLI